jgi:hypothetical protein
MKHWKGCARKWPCPNFKVLFYLFPGGTEEIYENLSQASRSPGRDLNPRPLEYENYELKRRRRVPIEGITLALARRDDI